ncbi:hypothetical protein KJ951_03360 [Patescibacteria group bacterium]|nr:hypothetical protein [Patescibacteria group bacterium]MBU1703417.1 hypothetical protein [Patescibacteria group bacterium]MBU1953868.1 hypothetical protein [Patescibacteria group bacterium]
MALNKGFIVIFGLFLIAFSKKGCIIGSSSPEEYPFYPMALTYSLKFKKLNFYNKVVLEKEGEIVVDRGSFRLKGKGAQDQGEVIFFSDMKDLHTRDDMLSFSTFSKEKYVLSGFSNLFDVFLRDFMRVRNEYFADTLFMRSGMLMHEYEGTVEIENSFGKIIPRGKSRIQFYEGSIVIIPETRECFPVYYGLIKGHEFDDSDYVLRLFLFNGQNIHISKLGTSFDDVKETMESLLGKMYEKAVNALTEFLPGFDATTLLKLVFLVKEGRLIPFKALKKIHEEMPERVGELLFGANPAMKEKALLLRRMGGDENFYISISFGKSRETGDIFLRTWFLQALPDKNLVATGRTSGADDNVIHFFRIIMHQGDPLEKLEAKILEIDQSMLVFRYDFSVVYKDRRELRKSKFKVALRKLSFLRLLRKSYIGYSCATDIDRFKEDLENIFIKAAAPSETVVAAAR